ncbi:MAG: cell division protein ZapA [Peptostreptococcaceae bacterium]
MNKVKVMISGTEYSMVSEKDEAHMLSISKYVNSEMGRIEEGMTRLAVKDIAILTCINIADQLFDCGYENELYAKDVKELEGKIELMSKEIDNNGQEVRIEYNSLKKNHENLKSKHEEEKNKVITLNQELEEYKKQLELLSSEKEQLQKEIDDNQKFVDEQKAITSEYEQKARHAEQLSSKFQNDNYKMQLEKVALEEKIKELKSTD